jgi:hypothetical protein
MYYLLFTYLFESGVEIRFLALLGMTDYYIICSIPPLERLEYFIIFICGGSGIPEPVVKINIIYILSVADGLS